MNKINKDVIIKDNFDDVIIVVGFTNYSMRKIIGELKFSFYLDMPSYEQDIIRNKLRYDLEQIDYECNRLRQHKMMTKDIQKLQNMMIEDSEPVMKQLKDGDGKK